jgi:VCBS repeat-containing protein
VNDAPKIISAIPDISVVEGNADGEPPFSLDLRTTFGDVDIFTDNQTLTFTLISGASPMSPPLYNATVNGDMLNIEFKADQFGSANLVIRATDSANPALFVDETIVVTVTRVNDPPITVGVDTLTTNEDTSVSVSEAVLLSNDRPGPANESGQTLTLLSVAAGPNTHGIVTRNGSGLITYTPNLNFNGTATFTYTVRDNGQTRNPATGLLYDDFKTSDFTVTATVNPVNDAPTLTPSGPRSLTPTTEDNFTPPNPTATTVSDILGGTATDVDGEVSGIAILAATGRSLARWEYSTDGGTTFVSFSTLNLPLADGNALLLRPSDRLRYVPDGQNGEQPTIRYRAWDQTSGTFGQQVDTTNNGGGTAFSAQTDVATITIQAVNDAPQLPAAATFVLTGTNEDTDSVGNQIAPLTASILDVDNGALRGIAITSLTGSGWEFSLDGGTNYVKVSNAVPAGVSESSALLLRSTDFVRYVPDRQNGGTFSFTYRAWDRSGTGVAGGVANITTIGTGGTTPFSANDLPNLGDGVNSASLIVTSVNDAPVLDVSRDPQLTTRTEDEVSAAANPGDSIATLLRPNMGASLITDVDNSAVEGIAIIGTTGLNASGWQYKLVGDANYSPVGAVSNGSARLLPATALLRYVPNTFNGETATVSFRAWDQSTGLAGGLGSTLVSGGSTSFSTTVEVATILITPENDSPVANGDSYAANEDVRLTVSGQGVLQNDTDVDVTVPPQVLSVSAVNGTPLSGNPLVISGMTSLGASFVVNANGSFTYDPTTSTELQKLPVNQSRQDSFRYKVRDNSGKANAESNEAVVTLTVTGVNDRPVSNNVSISATEDGAPVSAFFDSSDIDTGETGALRYTVLAQPSEGTVTASNAQGDAQFTFSPGTAFQDLGVGQTRQVTFTYRARDPQSVDSNVATVTVTVTGVNDAPVARNVSVTTSEDGPVVGDLFDVTDVDNDTLSYTIEDVPSKGTAVLS